MRERFAARHQPAESRSEPAASAEDIRPTLHTQEAANDDTHASDFAVFGDPLLGMAIASGILFAVMAALMAS